MSKSWQRPPRPVFKPFTIDYGKGPTEVSSMNQVRDIERQSERDYSDGKSAKIVFRAFSNDNTNYDVNTLDSEGHKQSTPRNPKVRGGSHAP
jgi:hypothetical protein